MAKPSITTRAAKGSALTWTEGDTNLTNLRDATIGITDGTTSGTLDLNDTLTFTAGTNVSLSYNATSKALTINSTASGGASTLNDLTDVTITSPGADHILKYDTLTSQWINGTPSTPSIALDGLSDVTTTTPSNGQALVYNGSTFQWENQTISGGTPAGSNQQIQFNNSGSFGASSSLTWTGTILNAPILASTQSSGDEGGQIELALAATNNLLTGSVAIDINQSQLRIFETGGSNRGVYINLASAATGVGTNLISSGGLTDIVQDTTPQLGGSLDVNGKDIVSVSNGNITITPNGTGQTIVKNIEYNENIFSLGTTSGTIAPNVANGNVQTITLNGNLTLNAFTSPVAGQSLTLIINTNGTGRTLTSTMKFAGGSKTLSTTSTTDIITVFYDGTNYWASLGKDFK